MAKTEVTYEFPNGEERDITVHFDYIREEKSTYWHPGSPAEVSIYDVTGDLTGIDVDAMIPVWEQKIFEDYDHREDDYKDDE